MSGISAINGSSLAYQNSYTKLSSGKKLNSAADGAAQLAISEREKAQAGGYNAGNKNISAAKSALNISDAALDGVTDYLQNIRELALKATNTVSVSVSDKEDIQAQIDQYKQGISQIAAETQYNTNPLLDGSNPSFELATNGNGAMYSISGGNATLEALGIADFDVTGDFDLKAIDNALESVTKQRSAMGAQSNALDHAFQYNANTRINTLASVSKLEDTEYGKAISDMKKNQVLQTYQYEMQKKKQEEEEKRTMNLFT